MEGNIVKRLFLITLLAISPFLFLATTATDSQAGLGLGIHYWKTLEDIGDSDGFDTASLGYLGVFSFGPALLNFEIDVEYVPNYWGDSGLLQPSAYVFIGHYIYGGLGVGISYLDGEMADDPFFDLRAGVKLSFFDLFASYRFLSFEEVGDLESDDLNSLTFGALIKF